MGWQKPNLLIIRFGAVFVSFWVMKRGSVGHVKAQSHKTDENDPTAAAILPSAWHTGQVAAEGHLLHDPSTQKTLKSVGRCLYTGTLSTKTNTYNGQIC